MAQCNYIDAEVALALHATVIGLTTGSLGVRDMNGLLGCLARPKTTIGDTEMFPTIFDKTAALTESIARNHAFIDGNKRTAYLSGAHLLMINGMAGSAKYQESLVDTNPASARNDFKCVSAMYIHIIVSNKMRHRAAMPHFPMSLRPA